MSTADSTIINCYGPLKFRAFSEEQKQTTASIGDTVASVQFLLADQLKDDVFSNHITCAYVPREGLKGRMQSVVRTTKILRLVQAAKPKTTFAVHSTSEASTADKPVAAIFVGETKDEHTTPIQIATVDGQGLRELYKRFAKGELTFSWGDQTCTVNMVAGFPCSIGTKLDNDWFQSQSKEWEHKFSFSDVQPLARVEPGTEEFDPKLGMY